jgi:hypothetical protein
MMLENALYALGGAIVGFIICAVWGRYWLARVVEELAEAVGVKPETPKKPPKKGK